MARISRKKEWPLIERVRILNLGPNDRVVLETPCELSQQEIELIVDEWGRAFPLALKPVVLTGGLTAATALRKET